MEDKIIIYTDGSSRGNPGPGGFGAILMHKNNKKELWGAYRKTTNNRMELLAVIAALEQLKRNDLKVEIYSDSKYVVEAIEKKWVWGWKRKGFKDKKNPDLWRRYLDLHDVFKPTFFWVKGHAENPFNNRCDELATIAAQSNHLQIDEEYEKL